MPIDIESILKQEKEREKEIELAKNMTPVIIQRVVKFLGQNGSKGFSCSEIMSALSIKEKPMSKKEELEKRAFNNAITYFYENPNNPEGFRWKNEAGNAWHYIKRNP